jgi:hypothetical protein
MFNLQIRNPKFILVFVREFFIYNTAIKTVQLVDELVRIFGINAVTEAKDVNHVLTLFRQLHMWLLLIGYYAYVHFVVLSKRESTVKDS